MIVVVVVFFNVVIFLQRIVYFAIKLVNVL